MLHHPKSCGIEFTTSDFLKQYSATTCTAAAAAAAAAIVQSFSFELISTYNAFGTFVHCLVGFSDILLLIKLREEKTRGKLKSEGRTNEGS